MIRAVIFDMDGVVLNSMPMHLKIWRDIFEKRGIDFSLKLFEKFNGMPTSIIAKQMIEEYGVKDGVQGIMNEKFSLEKKYQEEMLELFDDARPTIKFLKEKELKIGLGTSALPHMVEYAAKRFNLDKLFDCIASSSQVKNAKPAPDIFLLAAEKLGVKPGECIVVEDAVQGITAAKKAGMSAIAITTTFDKSVFKKADFIIQKLADLKDLEIENICVE